MRGPVLVDIVCPDLCRPLAFAGFRRNKDQEREAELIFFVEIHKRKLPDLKNVFHGISYESYCSVFFIFQCHSNVFVDLNANFLNKKSLTSVCVVLKCFFLPYLQPTLVPWPSNHRVAEEQHKSRSRIRWFQGGMLTTWLFD